MLFQLFASRESVREKRLGVRQAVCGKVVSCVSEVGQEFGQPRLTCVLLYGFGEILVGGEFAGIGFLERLFDFLDLPGFQFKVAFDGFGCEERFGSVGRRRELLELVLGLGAQAQRED